ncbi:hypothetical protein H4582DRAFT_190456 [Lactarius indigo]|nr:hypothetical protein H4582DRAFT_190456 [Lactarius indigo]
MGTTDSLVNVGFLAIPGVVISNLNSNITNTSQVVIFTSPAQIASCMSIVASAGSIVIGLLLIRHSGPKQNEDPAGASDYLCKNTHHIFGLERLAIIFSLLWALLMWSMMTFFIALLLFCFCISNASTRIFVAVTSVIVAVLVVWCIQNTWGSSDAMETWFSGLLPSIMRTLDNACATCHRILASIYFRPRSESLSSAALDRAGSVPATSYRGGVGVVV